MLNDISLALDWLYNQKKLKPREDLSRIKKCLELLEIKTPYKIIHIAGTNGKGSTASYLKNMLMLDNKRVGFFVSPYVICFNERIQINDEYISDSEVLKYVSYLQEFSEEYQTKYNDIIPFFELTFLMALLYFQDKKIDIAIIECGLGGLLDATNCLDTTVSVITNIGYDHQAQLGFTLKEIANHKLGIIKKGKPCFTGTSKELKAHFQAYANKLSSPIIFIEEDVSDIHYTNQLSFSYKEESYQTTLAGSYQAYNASLAIAVIKYLNPNYPKSLIDIALLNTKWPGRFEEILPNVILDGAHNLDGTQALVNSLKLKYPNFHIKVVFTALKDKAIKDMLKLLDEVTDYYYFTTIDDKRATSTDFFKDLTTKQYKLITSYKEAITEAVDTKDDSLIVITGSLHFISQAREYIISLKS